MGRPSIPRVSDARAGRRFVLALDRRLERLDRAILVADWRLFTGRSRRDSSAVQLRRAALLGDPRLLDWVRAARRRPWPPLLDRRLELLERILLDTGVEQDPEIVRRRGEMQRAIVAYRPRWQGRRVDRSVVQHALYSARDRTVRRRAFYALEPLHRSLEEPLRALVRLRNDRARAAGYRSFAEMRLGFEGLTPAALAAGVRTALAAAPAHLRRLRETFAEATGTRNWYPWDLQYARERAAPLPDRLFPRGPMFARVREAVRAWGFPIDRMRFRVVYHDVPAGGLTLAPDPPRDVRIVIHPRGGWLSYNILFHEVGHAVHSASIRAPRHLLRWSENVPGFGGLHEGIGGIFEDLAIEPAWLARVPGLDAARAAAFARAQRDGGLVWTAWTFAWVLRELALYRAPDRDPVAAAHRYERRLFGYDAFPPLSFVDPFFVDTPIYSANYLSAALFAAQVGAALRAATGPPFWPNRKVGPWLARHWFAPGSCYDWVPRVRAVTGRPFGPEAFRARFGRA